MTTAAQFLAVLTAQINRLAIMEADLDLTCENFEGSPIDGTFEFVPSPSTSEGGSPESGINETLSEAGASTRRSGRRKSQIIIHEFKTKRRVVRKPKKLVEDSNMKEIHSYYMDRTIKRLPPSLETIFEEPHNESFMSARKFRRTLLCYNPVVCIDKNKVKKRSLKAKKVCTIKKLNKKIAMDLLMKKLSVLESNEED